MKILIIGGCGYIGSALYRHLQQAHDVDSMDLELRGNAGIEVNEPINYSWAYRFDRWDAVIVMAGHSSVKAASAAPYQAFGNNLVNLVDLTQRLAGQMLIYASSAAVYADPLGQASNIYDVAKRAADQIVPMLYPQSWGLRFGTVGGPSPNLRLDTVVNAMVHDALKKGVISVSNPDIARPILGMGDLLRGVEMILDYKVPPGPQDMCSTTKTIHQIANMIADLVGARVEFGPDSPAYDFRMSPADWLQPTQSLDDIVRSVIGHFRGEMR